MRRSLVLISLLAVVAAACGGGSESTTTAPTTASPAVSTTAPETTEAPVSSDPNATPADGDTVGVFYTGTLDDGEQFDSNVGGTPLTFVVGGGQVISGFDAAVRGLKVGESVTVRLEPAEAYGEADPGLIFEVPAEGAPEGLAVGDTANFGGQPVVIVEIRDDIIVIDANPRLAGEALTFEIELVSIT
jgi:FKBP-type peptidyl-prolyl cis-trans isomerase 2